MLDGLGVGDIDFVAAFATSTEKIGKDLTEAIFLPSNNFPRLTSELPVMGVAVRRGLTDAGEVERVAGEVAGAEVVLYAAPSGRQETARAYAEAALRAGAAFLNTTSDAVARDRRWLDRFAAAGLPLLGDDLTSQFGTSVVHHALLRLLEERGLTLISSYQVNLGGTEDFRNLAENGTTKLQSKLNALTANGSAADRVQVAPRMAALLEPGGVFASFGGPAQLADPNVAEAVRSARAPFLDSDEVRSPDVAASRRSCLRRSR